MGHGIGTPRYIWSSPWTGIAAAVSGGSGTCLAACFSVLLPEQPMSPPGRRAPVRRLSQCSKKVRTGQQHDSGTNSTRLSASAHATRLPSPKKARRYVLFHRRPSLRVRITDLTMHSLVLRFSLLDGPEALVDALGVDTRRERKKPSEFLAWLHRLQRLDTLPQSKHPKRPR